jgi:DNA-binding NarL/FixJ family response regulator
VTAESITCLVGDDHAALRKGLVALLEAEQDITVVGQASDGPEALALLERRKPDVTIVDLRMPGMDGVELCRQVADSEFETSIVIYTAFDELEALDMALEAGAQGYVLKSGPPGELVRAVRMVYAGHPYIDPALAGGLLEHRLGGASSLLSSRETEVLQLLADGLTTEAVGRQLYLSPTTVRSYAENAMRKLEARNRVHAVGNALRLGLIT